MNLFLKISIGLTGLAIISGCTNPETKPPAPPPQGKIAVALDAFMSQIRDNKGPITIDTEKDILSGEHKVVLKLLGLYEQDASPEVRQMAYAMGHNIAKTHPDQKVRQDMVTRLVNGLGDSGIAPYQCIAKFLVSFGSADFTDVAKSKIHSFLIQEDPIRCQQYLEIVLVAGIADMKEEMPKLEKLLVDETKHRESVGVGMWYGTVGWAARLARARMGSQSDINRCITLIEAESDVVTRSVLLRHLSYIRQPAIVEALKRALNSDERLPSCRDPVSVNERGSPYATYAVARLSEILYNFPIKDERKRDSVSYTEEDIKFCRKWMSEQKEWEIIR